MLRSWSTELEATKVVIRVAPSTEEDAMWLMTTFGFFSVVQKPGDERLTVRARCETDLDALRARVPALGATDRKSGSDYPVRARIARADFALAMSDLVRELDYANFKSAVARRQGHERAHTYGKVWSALLDITRERSARRGVSTLG
jgi:hypothetical protein